MGRPSFRSRRFQHAFSVSRRQDPSTQGFRAPGYDFHGGEVDGLKVDCYASFEI